ncbi:MAG: hypothetical protein F6K22_38220 [Okeania sp. SIO2F4]|uniref:hypothetical protein n=1 Tax=Okeania sp. SIO2F4 TaxID=2607790 RepID=UPI00142A36F7|nr:hypothetical protein [Okeania sp. SIO2F4]NES08105.1 hypothetical protein [Okeania sp. SIO2F4]
MAKVERYWWGGKIELTHVEVVESTNAVDTIGQISAIVTSALSFSPAAAPGAPIAGILAAIFGLSSQILKNADKGNGVNIYWIDISTSTVISTTLQVCLPVHTPLPCFVKSR